MRNASADRQKMLAQAHGVLMSLDERLPLAVLDFRRLTTLEGRILVHGKRKTPDARPAAATLCSKEQTDRFTTSTTRRSWRPRGARAAFADQFGSCDFESYSRKGHPSLKIDELGDSELILRNKGYLRETARHLIRRGIVPQEDGWNGWLGRYQKALGEAATTVDGERPVKGKERDRRQTRGR